MGPIGDLWGKFDTPVYRVLDEHGANVADAACRPLIDEEDRDCPWIYRDDVDGWRFLTAGHVALLNSGGYLCRDA